MIADWEEEAQLNWKLAMLMNWALTTEISSDRISKRWVPRHNTIHSQQESSQIKRKTKN